MPGAIVLVGGAGTRLGGRAKPLLRLGGRTLLERSLAALAGCAPIVAVGPVLDPAAGIDWVREDPPRSGPVAAIAAGLAALGPGVPEVLVLAGDLAHP
ncbi:NTP transferase domain-containing protein, partial [Mycolicibacterium fallax]